MSGAEHEYGYADEIKHHRRHIQHIVRPVAPAGQEPVKVAENFFGPKINAAFARITVREFNHRDTLRPEEKHEGNQPQPDGNAAISRNRRHHVQVEYRDHKQQYEVPAAQNPLQMGLTGLRLAGWQIALPVSLFS